MRFEYLEPRTVAEALSLLARHNGKAQVVAGGTDLVVKMRARVARPQYVVDITNIPALDHIAYDDKRGLRLGALTTIRSLETSSLLRRKYPVISWAASQLGSMAIRNVATIGGNLCNAAPSAETAPALIGLSAKARLIGPDGERTVALKDFFTGPGSTVLQKGELLVEIQIPVPAAGTKGVYLKHGIRATIDLAIVSVAVILIPGAEKRSCQDIKIVLGAVASTPLRARHAEAIMKGKKISQAIIDRAAQAASDESRPISDVRASADYRKEMVKVFTRQAIVEAMR